MDVEGFETEVLKGGKGLFEEHSVWFLMTGGLRCKAASGICACMYLSGRRWLVYFILASHDLLYSSCVCMCMYAYVCACNFVCLCVCLHMRGGCVSGRVHGYVCTCMRP